MPPMFGVFLLGTGNEMDISWKSSFWVLGGWYLITKDKLLDISLRCAGFEECFVLLHTCTVVKDINKPVFFTRRVLTIT